MSGLTDRPTTAAASDTSPHDGDGAKLALLRATATVFAAVAGGLVLWNRPRNLLGAVRLAERDGQLTTRILASSLLAVGFGSLVASHLLEVSNGRASLVSVPTMTGHVAFVVVGTVIVWRHRGHLIGWLFVVMGTLWSLGAFGDEYARYAMSVRPELSGVTLAAWYGEWFWMPWIALTFVFVLALFPDGRPLPGPWRWPLWAVGVTTALVTVGSMFDPVLDLAMYDVSFRNPIGVSWITDIDDGGPFFVFLPVVLLGAVTTAGSLLVRYRRSHGEERQQLKWVLLAGMAVALSFPLHVAIDALVGYRYELVEYVIVLLPLAAGTAILRYRLYDIDVVISRTVVFAGLAGFITAIYVGIVVGIGTLLGTGDEPNLALSIVATAVVAVAFQPVRERLTRLANRLVFGKRATPYEVLSRFSSHLGETVATEQTLERMAQLLADGTGAAHAQVSLAIGGQMVPAASVGEVVDGSAEAHAVGVTHQGERLGALSVTKERGETLTPADVKLVDDLAAQAGLLLRNVRLTEELKARIVDLRASRQRLVAAQDQERRRLERDLHDGAQQQIVAMKLKLGIARTLAEREGATRTVELVEQLSSETDECVQTLRELAHGIYPPLLAAEGLTSAISTAARRASVPVTVEADGVGRYDQDVEAAVYFCVLEAITNATKYASPSHVAVRLRETEGNLTFEVTDDGTGFDPATTPTGHGLTNMTDRLDALGGDFTLASSTGHGTTARGSVPLRTEAPA